MDVDAVDAADGSVDFFDTDEVTDISDKPLWFGREVTLATEKSAKLEHLAQFFFANLQRMEQVLQMEGWADRFHLLDFQEEVIEEITSNLDHYADFTYLSALYHPSNREFTILDPKNYRTDIVQCKNFLKAGVKALGHGAKKVGKVSKKAVKNTIDGAAKGAKKVVKFVKEHPKEIAIGLAAVAVGVGAYYLGSLALAGSAAAASAGAAAQGGGGRREEEEGPISSTPIEPSPPPPKDPLPLSSFLSEQEKAHLNKSNPLSGLSAHLNPPLSSPPLDKTYQFKNGVSSLDIFKQHESPSIAGHVPNFKVPPSVAQEPSHLQSIISDFLEKFTHRTCNAIAATRPFIPDFLMEPRVVSSHIETDGVKYQNLRIGVINGMNTSKEEAKSHLEHIKKFAQGMSIEGVHNHSNTGFIDALEIFLLNYPGAAPITSDLLKEDWIEFHEENKSYPNAKYLQFTHSMGTILAKNALQKVPKEIRNRVIIVALGPAIIIPEGLCFLAVHYASKEDLVHLGQDLFTLLTTNGCDDAERAEAIKELEISKNKLILLEPHSDYEEGIDHDFESPTFVEVINKHIDNYFKSDGTGI